MLLILHKFSEQVQVVLLIHADISEVIKWNLFHKFNLKPILYNILGTIFNIPNWFLKCKKYSIIYHWYINLINWLHMADIYVNKLISRC